MAQCLLPNFSLEDSICLGASASISDVDTGFSSYQWNFDLQSTFDSINIETPGGIRISEVTGMEYYYDSMVGWVGIIGDFQGRMIRRFYFENGLDSAVTGNDVIATGDVTLGIIRDVKAYYRNGKWVAFAISWQSDKLIRLDFGNSLSNDPEVKEFLEGDFIGSRSYLEILENDEGLHLIVTQYTASDLRIYSLDGSEPDVPELVKVTELPMPAGMANINFLEKCGRLLGVSLVLFAGEYYVLDFGSSILNDPSVSIFDGINGLGFGARYLELFEEGDRYVLAFAENSGNLVTVDLDTSLSFPNPTIYQYPNGQLRSNVYKAVKIDDETSLFAIRSDLFKIKYVDSLNVSPSTSSSLSPVNPQFLNSGTYSVLLTVEDSLGNTYKNSRDIVVLASRPSEISLSSDTNYCLDFPTSVSVITDTGLPISTYQWSINGSSNPGRMDSTIQFTVEGENFIQVTVENSAGCTSQISDTFLLYSPPTVSFDLPDQALCENSLLEFKNTTLHPALDLITWRWATGDGTELTSFDAFHTFDSAATYDVQLIGSLSRCEDSTSKEIEVIPGVDLPFQVQDHCEGDSLKLANQSDTTLLISYSWEIQDKGVFNDFEPSVVFDSSGVREVTLLAVDQAGCELQSSNLVTTYALPEARWVSDLICEQGDHTFIDSSSSQDGQINQWTWNFSQGSTQESASSSSPSFFIQNTDQVGLSLKVTTEFGCEDSSFYAFQPEDIPALELVKSVNCDGDRIEFINNSSDEAPLENQVWWVDGITYPGPSVSLDYTGQDSVEVIFRATGQNGCSDSLNQIYLPDLSGVAQFSLPDSACIDELVSLTNENLAFESFQWDFSEGDLRDQPDLERYGSIPLLRNRIPGVSVLEDENDNLAFVMTSFVPRGLYLGIMQGGLGNDFEILGLINDPEAPFDNPYNSTILERNDSIHVLVLDATSNTLSSLSMGTSLQLEPERTTLVDEVASPFLAVDAVYAEEKCFALITFQDNYLLRVVLDEYLKEARSVDSIFIPNSVRLTDVKLVQECGEWFAFGTSQTGILHQLSFGSSLSNEPQIEEILTVSNRFTNVEHLVDGGEHFLHLSTIEGVLYQLNLGKDLSNPEPNLTEFGNFEGELFSVYGISSKKIGSTMNTFLFSGEAIFYTLTFPNADGPQTLVQFDQDIPDPNQFLESGWYKVGLKAETSDGSLHYASDSIFIRNDTSTQVIPSVGENRCVKEPTEFQYSAISSGTIVNQVWSFGNGDISESANVAYPYDDPGTYTYNLTVENQKKCFNTASGTIPIYEVPQARIDDILPITCTFDSITLTNASSQIVDSVISWNWEIESGEDTAVFEPTFFFESSGPRQVTLTASIPGCQTQDVLALDILQGSEVGFSIENTCFLDSTAFLDQTIADSIIAYDWSINQGIPIAAQNLHLVFDSAGDYLVSHSVINDLGCVNTANSMVTIHELPSPEFDTTLSCTQNEFQLYDRSSIVSGGIAFWNWTIEEGDSSYFSQERNPFFELKLEGPHEVQLEVVSLEGCDASTSGEIFTFLSPTSDFTVDKGCLSELTQFFDASSDPFYDIQSFRWSIDNNVFFSQNPQFTFQEADTFSISLSVTNALGCTGDLTKSLVIEPLPIPDFTFNNACQGDSARLINQTIQFSDSIVEVFWVVENYGVETGDTVDIVLNESGEGFVRMDITTANGCEVRAAKDITIRPVPSSQFSLNSNFAAAPFSLTTQNSSSGASSYQWMLNDSLVSTNEHFDSLISVEQNYILQLIAINEFGCSSVRERSFSVGDFQIDVSLDQLTIFEQPEGQTIIVSLENASTIPIDTFQLKLTVNGEYSLTFTENTTLDVATTYANYALDVSIGSPIEYACLSISLDSIKYPEVDTSNNTTCFEQIEGLSLDVYPTLTEESIFIKGFLEETETVAISLYTQTGKLVVQSEVTGTADNLLAKKLDLDSLLPGRYYLVIIGLGETQSYEIVKF